jgi:hypothetical protein
MLRGTTQYRGRHRACTNPIQDTEHPLPPLRFLSRDVMPRTRLGKLRCLTTPRTTPFQNSSIRGTARPVGRCSKHAGFLCTVSPHDCYRRNPRPNTHASTLTYTIPGQACTKYLTLPNPLHRDNQATTSQAARFPSPYSTLSYPGSPSVPIPPSTPPTEQSNPRRLHRTPYQTTNTDRLTSFHNHTLQFNSTQQRYLSI